MKKIFIILGIGLLLIAGILFLWLYSFIPDYDGVVTAPGLKESVVVKRNNFAVPTIDAKNEEDLFFAWGYVNAQDRMFQMEINRRAGQGRLAEFAGESALKKDIFLRAVGFRRIARREVGKLPPRIKLLFQRYVDGVNFYLDTNGAPLSFSLVGIRSERWQVEDLPLVGMMLNWVMSYNMKEEIMFQEIVQKIGADRAKELMKIYPEAAGTIIEGTIGSEDLRKLSRGIVELELVRGGPWASNNWSVSSKKSAYRGAILSNDPHVHYSKLPNDWYLIRIRVGDHEVAGAQVAGLPILVLGYNRSIAWGITNNNADMVDLFVEDVDLKAGTYRYQGRQVPLDTREETFNIKGRDPVTMKISYAKGRPLLHQVFPDMKTIVSFAWTGFDGMGIEGFYHLTKAKNYREFLRAVKGIGIAPQNMVYADREGNCAYQLVGWLPDRIAGTGTVMESGSRRARNWRGYLPFERNPSVANPARGFVATANNIVSKRAPYMNGMYHPSYRYERIEEMLLEKDKIDVEYIKKMHMDVRTLVWKRVKPIVREYIDSAKDKRIPAALALLEKWDGSVDKDAAAPSLFNTFVVRFMFNTFSDELGDELAEMYVANRRVSLDRLFYHIEKRSSFFDDVSTAEKETVRDIATRSLIETLDILQEVFDNDQMSSWKWGEIHQIHFNHLLGKSKMLRPLVDFGPLPYEGDCDTVNNGLFHEMKPPFVSDFAAGVRMIVRFDDEPRGWFMQMTGENGYFMSKHYTDMTKQHLRGGYFCMEEEEQIYELRFSPEEQSR